MNVLSLKKGQKARIETINDPDLGMVLMELGLMPGSEISMVGSAPSGCPLILQVEASRIGIRKEEASRIIVSES